MWRPRLRATTTARLATGFAAALALSALLPILFIHYQVTVLLTERIDRFLEQQSAAATPAVQAELLARDETFDADDLHRIALAARFDAAGRRVAGNIETLPPGLAADGRAHAMAVLVRRAGGPPRPETMRVVARRLPDGGTFVIGGKTWALSELRATVAYALWLWIAPILLVSLTAGAVLSRHATARVRAMHLATRRIMQGNLRERLHVGGSGDDMDMLALSINSMLGEIERLVEQLQSVGNDIAHGLRTPLARMKARLDNCRMAPQPGAALDGVIEDVSEDLRQTLRIVTALLRLAEIDGERRRSGFGRVDLAALVAEVAAFYEPLAASRDIRLALRTAPLSVPGDADLLGEALANLVDNGIKFTPPGGSVEIALAVEGDGAVLRVSDTGAGLRPGEHERVFERFYRAEETRSLPGTGLGLSLVAAIARLHGGRVRVSDNAPGTIFDFVLPMSAGGMRAP